MPDREDLIRRIKRLRELTTKRGCTEAEAMAAAEKAAKLMAEYGVSADDVEIVEARIPSKFGARSPRAVLVAGIVRATNTASLHARRYGSSEWLFIGLEPGPEIAVYLLEVCGRAVDRELREFKRGAFYKRRRSIATRKEAAADFAQAMSHRLANRMIELFADTACAEKRERADAALAARHSFTVVDGPRREPRYGEA